MCFVSDNTVQYQYWMTDLTTPKNISHILYQSRVPSRVNGMQIRAGLSSTITDDPVVVTLTYVAEYYLQSYKINPPLLARYIGITGPNYSQLELCSLMIFE